MTWAHKLMKPTAEKASPRTWAQLIPTDLPPHLKSQTCIKTKGEKAKSGPRTWLGTRSLCLESFPDSSHSSRLRRHLASMMRTPPSLHLIHDRPESALLSRPQGM
ncbi:hypothetical protein HanXRQr2_Chr11g0506771 [Helianthus annuus]|uniref:Uncharacterized protein n=1 Tax=Helianthus annuus TaxID=4232 RepID=A0A9K3N190_HELAN|nr:hypothetical protein HanXRQr2_Chr11g0506771 [Helianthus annuus]KAJ0876431.1 hypothetical protein HanPSC8_Chr11g0488391 [Helianthus annuus]